MCRGYFAMITCANGDAQDWDQRVQCRRTDCRPMAPLANAISVCFLMDMSHFHTAGTHRAIKEGFGSTAGEFHSHWLLDL